MGQVVSTEERMGRSVLRVGLAGVFALALILSVAPGGAAELNELEDDPFADYEEQIEENNDPLELPNRFIFAFNQTLDVALIRPIAWVYRELVPQYARDRLRNVLRNLRSPIILANDLLQGEFDRAGDTANRFVINSTAGILGIWDVAVDLGYPYHDEDFGQTLGALGIPEGPYLVLPLLGPSNVRDATGKVVDRFLDPFTYIADDYGKEEWMLYRFAAEGIDFRARNIDTLDEIERDAIDFYARIRSLYRQRREAQINNELDDDELEVDSGDTSALPSRIDQAATE